MNAISLITSASGILSVIFAVYCGIPYIRSVLDGRTKPHQFTWMVFAFMNGITVLSQFLAGARLSILVNVAFFAFNLLEIGLSFKYGVRDTSRYDRLLFGLCLLTIVIWIATKSNVTAIWLTVLIDVMATTMLILKIRARPGTEAVYAWVLATLAYVFSCISLIDKHSAILFVRPFYGLLSDLAIVVAILYYTKGREQRRSGQADIAPQL